MQWFKLTKQGATNITAVATLDLPRSRGQKKSRSTQIRRGAANSNKKKRTTVDHYAHVNEVDDPPSQVPGPANMTKNTLSHRVSPIPFLFLFERTHT